jgi:CheY-like chemotaxis protein
MPRAVCGRTSCFVDLALPRLDAYQVARRLRADSDLPNVRLIALRSGNSNNAGRTRAAGFDDSVDEPVDPALIRNLLGKGC